MTEFFGFEIRLPLMLAGPALVVLFGAIGLGIGRLVVGLIVKAAQKTPTDWDDVILGAVRRPVCIATALAGAWLALRALPLSHEIDPYLNRGWIVLSTLLLVVVGLRMITGISKEILIKSPALAPSSAMVRVVGRIVVLSLGGVMLLQSLGIAVEPLIASLGIGSLAVGLALKDTLSNFFAGVYLFADRPVRVGDYVRLESGEEGFVQQIGWRATRIQMPANNLIIVPNGRLSESILTNYNMPDPTMSCSVPVVVSMDADPPRVMEILVEEASRAFGAVPGLVAQTEPLARFHPGFADNGLGFILIVQVGAFTDQFLVQSALRERIFARFRKEGIALPFPTRTLHAPELERILAERPAAPPELGGTA
jgi:small-conductance mechanosensitive channel